MSGRKLPWGVLLVSFFLVLSVAWLVVPAIGTPAREPATGWIWSHSGADQDAPHEVVYFRYEFQLDAAPSQAMLLITCDNSFQLFVNGVQAADSNNWKEPIRRDVAAGLRAGRNCLAVRAANGQPGDGRTSPAGLIVQAHVRAGEVDTDISSSAAWRWSTRAPDGWTDPGFDAAEWQEAVVLGPADMRPWSLDPANVARDLTPMLPPRDWQAFRRQQQETLTRLPKPADPPGDGGHPIDRFLESSWAEIGFKPEACDDATFARRAWLDIIGLIPTEQELERFLADPSPNKRKRLIDALLDDDLGYAEGWMAWWCDLLRNDEQTSIDGLRKPVTRWLFAALRDNLPYDRMVAELLNPGPEGPDGYLMGINWRGDVSASQIPPVQAAQNVGQVFLGTNIKCASCHDHFTRPYLLEDAYGLASFFSETNLEIFRCDKPTGQIMPPEFLLGDVKFGSIPADSDLATRLQAVSGMVTSPENNRFATTMVNRVWKKLTGRGLFEPVDDFGVRVSHPELLDWLAYEFMRSEYDLKALMRLVMTSQAYQLRSISESQEHMREAEKEVPAYTGPLVRRLTSEQLLDSASRLTGYWPDSKVMDVDVPNPSVRAWRHRVPDPLARALGRPNREQITTVRMEDASMLQMLELTNGMVMAERLTEGARTLLASPLGQQDPQAALDTLYLRAVGREADETEHRLLAPMLGTPEMDAEVRRPGWEDVCWILMMNPEFQFTH